MKIKDVASHEQPVRFISDSREREIEIEDNPNAQIVALTIMVERLQQQIDDIEVFLNI